MNKKTREDFLATLREKELEIKQKILSLGDNASIEELEKLVSQHLAAKTLIEKLSEVASGDK